MNGLCLASVCIIPLIMYEYVYKGRSELQGKTQSVLILATGLNTTEGATQSEQQDCRPGERRPQ